MRSHYTLTCGIMQVNFFNKESIMKYRIKVQNHSVYTVYRKSLLFWKPQAVGANFTLVDSKRPAKFESVAQAVDAVRRSAKKYQIEYIFSKK